MNETVKKAIKLKENGLQQLKEFLLIPSLYREQSKSLVQFFFTKIQMKQEKSIKSMPKRNGRAKQEIKAWNAL